MQFDSPNITVSLVFAFAVSVTMALPLPITRNASNFRDAVESVAKVYADQVEKEYGTGNKTRPASDNSLLTSE